MYKTPIHIESGETQRTIIMLGYRSVRSYRNARFTSATLKKAGNNINHDLQCDTRMLTENIIYMNYLQTRLIVTIIVKPVNMLIQTIGNVIIQVFSPFVSPQPVATHSVPAAASESGRHTGDTSVRYSIEPSILMRAISLSFVVAS